MGSQCLESLVLFEKEESFYHLLGAFLKEPGSPCQEVPQINGLLTAPWGGVLAIPQRGIGFGKLSSVETFQVVDSLGFCADRAHPGLVCARRAFIRGRQKGNFYNFLLEANVCLWSLALPSSE